MQRVYDPLDGLLWGTSARFAARRLFTFGNSRVGRCCPMPPVLSEWAMSTSTAITPDVAQRWLSSVHPAHQRVSSDQATVFGASIGANH